jgi:hypothetical protein
VTAVVLNSNPSISLSASVVFNGMGENDRVLRAKTLIQGRELAVPVVRPPTLFELIFDAANLCTILAMLFDLYAITSSLRDKNPHLAIAFGQMSAM